MPRKSNAMIAQTAAVVNGQIADAPELNSALRNIVDEIDSLMSDAQAVGVRAFWNVGRIITEVSGDPDKYLTDQQRADHVDAGSLLISVLTKIYSSDQLYSAVAFFDKYPSEFQLNRLLDMRCPDSPRWRITQSHVNLLTQISDDEQRSALEEKCASNAFTARVLAQELQEIRGKRAGGGRKHKSPKGLKQQLDDLLQYVRKFVGRSQAIWLNDDEETLYDVIVNTAPSKLDETVMSKIRELSEKFTELSDAVGSHIQLLNNALRHIDGGDETAETVSEDEDTNEESTPAARAAAAAAAAAQRRTPRTMTR